MLPIPSFNVSDWINCGTCGEQFEIRLVFQRSQGYCSRCRQRMSPLDLELLCAAEGAIAGYGDGRISHSDLQEIMAIVSGTGWFSPIEKATLELIHRNYRFTGAAEQLYNTELGNWPRG